jgi:hypothetical protein
MSNYGDMQSRIADEIGDSTLTSQIQLAIQTAIKFYERREFYFNTKNSSFSTVANQEYYGSAALSDIPNLVRIKTMYYTENDVRYPIVSAANSDIDFNQNGQMTGEPQLFSYVNEQIRLFYIPDAVYTVTMNYIYRLETLSASSDENAWTDDGEELIRQRAKKVMAGDVLRDVGMYQAADQFERDALKEILMETASRRSNITLRTEIASRGHYNIYIDT